MSGDVYLGDKTIADGEAVYLDAEETTRLYNDGGVLKCQTKVADAWVDQQSWGE